VQRRSRASVDSPEARDDTIARNALLGHAKVLATVLDQLVNFLETPFVKKQG